VLSTTDIPTAVAVLREGGIIAYPTETLPGLGCLASSETAVKKLLKIKNRPADKGLILLASKLEQLKPWIAPLGKTLLGKLSKPATTPTTWLVTPDENAKLLVRGKHHKLAVRITNHPVAAKLCDQLGEPVISTSANLTGEPAPQSLGKLSPAILKQLDLILDGSDGSGQPSQIRDLESSEVFR